MSIGLAVGIGILIVVLVIPAAAWIAVRKFGRWQRDDDEHGGAS